MVRVRFEVRFRVLVMARLGFLPAETPALTAAKRGRAMVRVRVKVRFRVLVLWTR